MSRKPKLDAAATKVNLPPRTLKQIHNFIRDDGLSIKAIIIRAVDEMWQRRYERNHAD